VALLQLTHFSLQRGQKQVIHDLNLSLDAGEIAVVLGPNGAGKSSLLLALAGFMPYTDGEVLLKQQPLSSYARRDLARHLAWQGELPPTEFGLTVQQRLQLVNNEVALASHAALVGLELSALLPRALGELSAGERQRVELAALMLRDVPLWLLDEPTAHLDLKHQIACLKLLRDEAQCGRTLLLVLHDIQQAETLADWLVFVDGKGGVEVGRKQEMLTLPRLCQLYGVPLMQQGKAIIPDYSSSPYPFNRP